MSLQYSSLVVQECLLFLRYQGELIWTDAWQKGLSRVCSQLGNMASLLELWVRELRAHWTMLSTYHTWFEGGRSHGQHTLLSKFQSSVCSNVSRVIRFMTCHREQFLPLTYLGYRYKHKHSSGASQFWPKLELIWLSSHARSCFLNYGSFPASTLK